VYSTFLGGTDIDDAHGIAVDGAGNAYVTGETVSADFPTTAGALQRTRRGQYDVFVTKLNATGSALVYSTFLGGAAVDNGERIAVDASGRAFVMGFSSSRRLSRERRCVRYHAERRIRPVRHQTECGRLGAGLLHADRRSGDGGGGGLAIDAVGQRLRLGRDRLDRTFRRRLAAFDPAAGWQRCVRPQAQSCRLGAGVLHGARRNGR
jgi:hypothetical protein